MAGFQKTIRNPVSLRGPGVHSGRETRIRLLPAPPGHGVVFFRTDLPDCPAVPAAVERVSDTSRGTNLGKSDARVRTVEHLLSALYGLEIDNVRVEMDGPELPMGDGSALPYVRLIESAQTDEQTEPRSYVSLRRPVYFSEGDGVLVALPDKELKISATISFEHGQLDAQYLSLQVTPEVFSEEIAPARTFGFYRDAVGLMEKGLIKASSLDNTVVIGEEAIFSKNGLRFRDEFVRHKILDLLGDLYLLGHPLLARVIAVKPGHSLNARFVKKLKEEIDERS